MNSKAQAVSIYTREFHDDYAILKIESMTYS